MSHQNSVEATKATTGQAIKPSPLAADSSNSVGSSGDTPAAKSERAKANTPSSTPPQHISSKTSADDVNLASASEYSDSRGPSTANLSQSNLLNAGSSSRVNVDTNGQDPHGQDFQSQSLHSHDQTAPPIDPRYPGERRSHKKSFLGRTRSNKPDDLSTSRHRARIERTHRTPGSSDIYGQSANPQTAPLQQEPGFRSAMAPSRNPARNRSADRTAIESDEEAHKGSKHPTGQGPNFFSRATDGIAKSGKGFFNKIARSGSGTVQDPLVALALNADNYVFQAIEKPLVEQTRLTRIKKTLSGAGDKTEYWMPALAYRCIDYLNCNGVDAEGLYRVSGSQKEIKKWQMKFDTGPHYDVDLLEDGIELYDLHVVGSMLKAWLRQLPDELLPRSVQDKLAQECEGATKTPQAMKDALSNLPPYNYFLLFAITCHISLLHSHADKNKMNYQNLCVCFKPCIKIDNFCFYFLVQDWRNCWQGCRTESEYYAQELELARMHQHLEPQQQQAPHAGNSSATATEGSSSRHPNNQQSTLSLRQPPPSPNAGPSRNQGTSSSANAPGRQQATTPPSIEPVATISPIRLH